MRFHVRIEVGLGSCHVRTHAALVGLLAHVRANMIAHIFTPFENLP